MRESGGDFRHHFLKQRIENLWVLLVGKVPEIGDADCVSEGQVMSH